MNILLFLFIIIATEVCAYANDDGSENTGYLSYSDAHPAPPLDAGEQNNDDDGDK